MSNAIVTDLGKDRCAVTVAQGALQVTHAEYGQYEVLQALAFSDSIDQDLSNHSSTAIWWAAMSSEEATRLHLFKEGIGLRYLAHCRYYAKLALKGLGDKETLEAVKDYVCLIFSAQRSPLCKSILQAAFYGSLLNEYGTATAVKKVQDGWTPEMKLSYYAAFERTLYSWETDFAITYDTIVETEAEISKNVEVLKAVSEQFKQRGVLLSTLGGVKKAEYGAIGVGHVNGFNKDANTRFGHKS